ncbi:MAG: TIGR03086 family protein [Chloroflexi bacterium]|nr:TIGR03086 family protein [Chloroflexota bacterium]
MAESDLPTLYKRIAATMTAHLEGCPPDKWGAQSPCDEWTARDVALHATGTQRGLLGDAPLDNSQDLDVVAEWKSATGRLAEELTDAEWLAQKAGGPFGDTPRGALANGLLLADTLLHTWDFARATGQDERLDPEGVHKAYEFLKTLGDRIRRPGGFKPAIEPPAGADEQSAFVCYAGRPA